MRQDYQELWSMALDWASEMLILNQNVEIRGPER